MLTALDILNRLLGYFNIQDKAKGKAFTIVAFLANFYLLYVSILNLRYAAYRLYGVLFLLLFLVLLYFIALNFVYYFTDKRAKFDISPKVEKLLGGNQAQLKAAEQQLAQDTAGGPASGLFDADKLLPTAVSIAPAQQRHLDDLVQALTKQGAMTLNYQGLDDRAVTRVAQKNKQPVPAMGAPVPVPYYTLRRTGDSLEVIGGLNALTTASLATVTRVGLMPVAAALADYELAAAQVVITGGESKVPGRHGVITRQEPYGLSVQLAYSPRKSVSGRQ